ncbi:MAG TPA: class I SAM-dependent methyltransferase [Bryobacteraceae bacterium]|nr:class I SAM-dependent methyltransferase [Bryobacteraceae bacterium]
MNRLILSALLLTAAMPLIGAEPANRTEAFRKDFLEAFQRTGLNTTPGDAMLLRILVESRGAKRGVEIGTASGFGAMNMGIAFERTGGHLYTLEIDPARAKDAQQNLAKIGLEKTVTVMEGDALQTLPKLEGEFDFVFIDAAKPQYLAYLKALEPKLKRGAVVVADNVIVSQRAMADFLKYIENSADYDTVTIRSSMEKNDGMTVSYKVR